MMTEEIDWAKVALDYRNTDIPLRGLARRHGVSHSGILRRVEITYNCPTLVHYVPIAQRTKWHRRFT